MPYLDIRKRISARIDGYYSFAVVRNPWNYGCFGVPVYKKASYTLPAQSRVSHDKRRGLCGLKLSPSSHPRNRLTQNFLADSNGDIGVDFVGRFERINEDSSILERLGIEADLPLRIRHNESLTGTITALEASIWWLNSMKT